MHEPFGEQKDSPQDINKLKTCQMAKSRIYRKEDILRFLTILGTEEKSGKELTHLLVKDGVITAELKEGKIDYRLTNFMRAVKKMIGKDAIIITRGVPNNYSLAITQEEALSRLESYVQARRTKTTTPKEKVVKVEEEKVEDGEEKKIVSCARKFVEYCDNRNNYTLKEAGELLRYFKTNGFNYKAVIEFVLDTQIEDLMRRVQKLRMEYLGN